MPTYLYETIPETSNDVPETFEVKQRFSEPPLTVHPRTGAAVRRVISGGIGLMTKSDGGVELPQAGPGCGPGSCGCGRFD